MVQPKQVSAAELEAQAELLWVTAKHFLKGYLEIVGRPDPDATVIVKPAPSGLDYFRTLGPNDYRGLLHYILPSEITAEINRRSQGIVPKNPELVDVIDRANQGETIEGSITDRLKEHYEKANVAQPQPAYLEELNAISRRRQSQLHHES
jgi:hypothetical protein